MLQDSMTGTTPYLHLRHVDIGVMSIFKNAFVTV